VDVPWFLLRFVKSLQSINVINYFFLTYLPWKLTVILLVCSFVDEQWLCCVYFVSGVLMKLQFLPKHDYRDDDDEIAYFTVR